MEGQFLISYFLFIYPEVSTVQMFITNTFLGVICISILYNSLKKNIHFRFLFEAVSLSLFYFILLK